MTERKIPSVGDKVLLGSFEWEVAEVKKVDCDYDPDYYFRVDLIIRDENGTPVNWATNISNLMLEQFCDE